MDQPRCFRFSLGTHERLFFLSSDWGDEKRPESEGIVLDVTVADDRKEEYPLLEMWNCGGGLNRGYIDPNLPYKMFHELGGYDMVVIRAIGDMEEHTASNLVDYLLSTKDKTKVYCQDNGGRPRIFKKCCKVVTPLGEEMRLIGEESKRLGRYGMYQLLLILKQDCSIPILLFSVLGGSAKGSSWVCDFGSTIFSFLKALLCWYIWYTDKATPNKAKKVEKETSGSQVRFLLISPSFSRSSSRRSASLAFLLFSANFFPAATFFGSFFFYYFEGNFSDLFYLFVLFFLSVL